MSLRRAPILAALVTAGGCTWIPGQDVTTTGSPGTDPGVTADDTGTDPTNPGTTTPTREDLAILAFAPGRAGRLNRIEVAGATPGAALAVWSSASPSWDAVDGCPGLMVSPPELCASAPAAAEAVGANVAVQHCVPADYAGRTVDFRVVQADGCHQSPVRSVTFPDSVDLGVADADTVLPGETLYDAAGDVVAMGDVDGDGLADVLVGAPFYGGANYPGRAYLLYGPLDGDASLAAADVRLDGQSNLDQAGDGVAVAGDVDGQGGAEIAVGAPTYDGNGTRRGRVYLVAAPPAGTSNLGTYPSYVGASDDDMTGWAVAGAGDVDGDQLDDLLVGAPQFLDDYAGAGFGKVLLFRGNAVLADAMLAPAARFLGAAGDAAGEAVAGPGDTDGDGLADVLLGAPFDDTRGTEAGAAYLFSGASAVGDVAVADADGVFLGEDAFNTAGWSVGGGDDLDGDGLMDVLVGADWNSSAFQRAGASYVVYGRTSPATLVLTDADAKITGEAATDFAGGAVASAGDVDGDGFADLVIGARGADAGGDNGGAAYVVHGPVYGGVSLADADVRIAGSLVRSFVGVSVAGGADTDGDGLDDVLIGSGGLGAFLFGGATLSGQ
ncbi:MAG: integrin alpha [Myxococcota bacterium]